METKTREDLISDLHSWRPAYPMAVEMAGGCTLIEPGVSTLDYFAVKAMAALIASGPLYDHSGNYLGGTIAREAYCIAQSMRDERERLLPRNQEPA